MMKSSWIAGIMGVVLITSLNWSSMCHPTPEGEAMQDQIRQVALAKSEDPVVEIVYEELLEKDYSELTWQRLSDVEFRDVFYTLI